MCGIAAIFDLGAGQRVDGGELERMLSTIQHRGPDACRVETFPGGGLGHVRLAIVDLSHESDQPFASDDGRYLLSYNGEIFNYIELRAELEQLGHRFRTHSDTEVLLHSYMEWGAAAVSRFNGMWAFAIYDRERDELFCSRDRFGIKPFFYAESQGRLILGSEVKALLAVDRQLARPDYGSLSRFLRSGAYTVGEGSFFESVKRLPPAHNMVVTRAGAQVSRYWDYPTELVHDDWPTAVERVRELLIDSIRLRMRSDVPVGSTLSAGVDSSSTVCLMRTFFDGEHDTYTASYPGESFDEAPEAGELARELGMRQHAVDGTPEDFLETLGQIVHHLDQPTVWQPVIPFWSIMRRAREEVVVLLEGQGADEMFGGYDTRNFSFALADFFTSGKIGEAGTLTRAMVSSYGWRGATRFVWSDLMPGVRSWARRLRGDESVYAGPLLGLHDTPPAPPAPRFHDRLTTNLHRWHSGTLQMLLHNEDALSMAHSLESRLPFMDYRLVEYAFQLPGSYKVRGGYGKAVLREAARPELPDRLSMKRKKIGMETPMARWFRERPEETIYPVLHSERARQRGIFDAKQLDIAIERHRSGRWDMSPFILLWLSTELWFQKTVDAS